MAMTRGRFQGREPNQGGWDMRPALESLSEQRADELLKKLGGRGAVSSAGSGQEATGDIDATPEMSDCCPFSEDIPGMELVFQSDVLPGRGSARVCRMYR
jgi:hypothetical protein